LYQLGAEDVRKTCAVGAKTSYEDPRPKQSLEQTLRRLHLVTSISIGDTRQMAQDRLYRLHGVRKLKLNTKFELFVSVHSRPASKHEFVAKSSLISFLSQIITVFLLLFFPRFFVRSLVCRGGLDTVGMLLESFVSFS
jgi:hypothetical protein